MYARSMQGWPFFFLGFAGAIMSFFHTVLFDNAVHNFLDTGPGDAKNIDAEIQGQKKALRETRNPFRKIATAVGLFHLKAQKASSGKAQNVKNTKLFLRLWSITGPMMHMTMLGLFVVFWEINVLIVINIVVLNGYLLLIYLFRGRINRFYVKRSAGKI